MMVKVFSIALSPRRISFSATPFQTAGMHTEILQLLAFAGCFSNPFGVGKKVADRTKELLNANTGKTIQNRSPLSLYFL